MRTGNVRTHETGIQGMNLVISEVEKRGATVERGEGQTNLLHARSAKGNRQVNIRTKTKGPTSRVWQVSIEEARKPEEPVDSDEFWVLVDLPKVGAPQFYIIPGTWLRRDIYEEHQKYLEAHGGERPVTPDSTHHSITLRRVEDYENRWDLLQL